MKILFFSSVVWNFYKGRAQELSTALSKLSNECVYAEPIRYQNWKERAIRLRELSENEVPANLRIIGRTSNFKKSPLFLIYENFKNCVLIREYGPEVVISNDSMMSLFPCIYAKLKGIKFVFDVLDDWEAVKKNKMDKAYWKYIAKPVIGRLSFAVTSTSHKQYEEFKKYQKNVFLVPNGKSTSYIKEAENFHGITPKKEVNFISSLRCWYDFDLIFDVFKEFPDLQLNIYGKGELYEHLLKKSGNYKNIKVLGSVDGREIPKLIAESFFGILPLKLNRLNDSTSPVKLFDYWAAKKAVIASPTYELKKIGEGCVLFASNKQEFVDAVNKILNDKTLREKLETISFRRIMEVHNYDKIEKTFEDIIQGS